MVEPKARRATLATNKVFERVISHISVHGYTAHMHIQQNIYSGGFWSHISSPDTSDSTYSL